MVKKMHLLRCCRHQVAPYVFVSLTCSPSVSILCRDGIKLSENDEKFIVENILSYHPEKEKKVAGHDNYITVPSLPFYLSMHQKNQTRNVMKILSLLAG
jgi:hypothetical protein